MLPPEAKQKLIHEYRNAIRDAARVWSSTSIGLNNVLKQALAANRAWPLPGVATWSETSFKALFEKLDQLTEEEVSLLNSVKNTVILEVMRESGEAATRRAAEAGVTSDPPLHGLETVPSSDEIRALPPHLAGMARYLADRGLERSAGEEELYREFLLLDLFSDDRADAACTPRPPQSLKAFAEELQITSTEPSPTVCGQCLRPF